MYLLFIFKDTENRVLRTAVALKKLKLVNILLEGGVKVNHKGYYVKTALILVCSVFIEDVHHPHILYDCY